LSFFGAAPAVQPQIALQVSSIAKHVATRRCDATMVRPIASRPIAAP